MAPTGNRQDARRRAERAHQLRAIGRTWQEIADVLGYRTRQSAMHAVARLLDRTPPVRAEALRRQEAEELRIRRAALHERFADARQRKDDDALVSLNRELDRVATRWSKLHGLDAPERQEVNVNVTQTATAIIADARERLLAVVDAEIVELPRTPNKELTA
jgi:AraC-like DNA-binding protein